MSDNLIRKQIATRLRELRDDKGWSQETAARHIGCSWRAVQRWERGHAQPSWDSVELLAKAYGVTPSQIIGQDSVKTGTKPATVESRLDQLTLQVSQLQAQLNSLYQRLELGPHQGQDDGVEI